ncbi:MAG TPA: DegT/DnrJ/EryC1/StrS family aminotransferase, partial [Terriglobia bacterium]|nr:DegT/DnrJ/EryC1/StrS family aminotransferase [Terriglobia bacterium]
MNEAESRAEILKLVRAFYENFHAPRQNAEFVAGESSLPYGGRVYNAEEMEFLVDAALDFWLTSGRYTREFESTFAKKIGRKSTLLTNSGSSANLLAFSALTSDLIPDPARRIQKSDEVITVAAGFPTTVTPIL